MDELILMYGTRISPSTEVVQPHYFNDIDLKVSWCCCLAWQKKISQFSANTEEILEEFNVSVKLSYLQNWGGGCKIQRKRVIFKKNIIFAFLFYASAYIFTSAPSLRNVL